VPCRDFLLPLPPFYPVFIACIQSLFGESLVPLHWVGLVINGLIGLVIYALLRELFPPGVTGVAAAMGLLYYQSGNAFIGYDFTQLLTLWLLLAALMLAVVLRFMPALVTDRPVFNQLFSMDRTTTDDTPGWTNVSLPGAGHTSSPVAISHSA